MRQEEAWIKLVNLVVVFLLDKVEFKCDTNAGTYTYIHCKTKNKTETKDTINTWLIDTTERIKQRSQDSFRNSGHLAKRLTSAYRECVFF